MIHVYAIMLYTEVRKILHVILLIDFEKGFDTQSWNYLLRTLWVTIFLNMFRPQKLKMEIYQYGFRIGQEVDKETKYPLISFTLC